MNQANNQVEKIKELIGEILSKLTVDASIDVAETADGPYFCIRTHEGSLLIGENGKNLISLNHLVKKIMSRQVEEAEREDFVFSLDVNEYQAKKIEELKNLARVTAQRVRYFKKEVALKTMSSFERRVIHATLADCPDIMTGSQGGEPQRYVVVKPIY